MNPRLVLVLTENWAMMPGAVAQQAPAAVAKWAREAEAAGFDAVMVGQSLRLGLNPAEDDAAETSDDEPVTNSRPTPAAPSALTRLATVAACTDRIRLIAPTVITTAEHPVLLAKDFATLDRLSGGRLVVQPLVSQNRREYEDAPVRFEDRQEWLEEMLEIWEATWKACAAGAPVTHHGRYFSFEDVSITPGPSQESGPPMWLGPEALHPNMIRRMVRFGAGYSPMGRPAPSTLVQLADAMDAAGRPAASLELVATIENPSRDGVGRGDLGAALAPIPLLMEMGFGTFCVNPAQFLDDPSDISAFCQEVVERARQLAS